MKNLGLLPILLAILLSACTSQDKNQTASQDQPADVSGYWSGVLDVSGQKLRLGISLKMQDSRLQAFLDSPDQDSFGLPLETVEQSGRKLTLKDKALGLSFALELLDDDTALRGTLKQGGMNFKLSFIRSEPLGKIARPQDPKAPFSYNEREVRFTGGAEGVELSATLSWPKEGTSFPAVVLISGSGPQNRNEEIANHRPFWVLADALNRAGIAVLRYDDRGFAKSTGSFETATSMDFALDAAKALDFLENQDAFTPTSLGAIGHSEGAIIAPILAQLKPDLDFIVLLGAPGLKGSEVLLSQTRAIMEASKAAKANIDLAYNTNKKIYNLMEAGGDDASLRSAVTKILKDLGSPTAQIEATLVTLFSPWFRYFLSYDPAPVLANTSIPVLALTGQNDMQVLADINMAAIRAAFGQKGNAKNRVEILPGLNHLFQHSETGRLEDYGSIEETFAPEVLGIIADWILKL